MTSAYFRELKRYTFKNILEKLSLNEDKGKVLVNRLKSYGVLKTVRKIPNEINLSEIDDEEIDILEDEADSSSIYYVFKFVGIVTIRDTILICYPKYINKTLEPENEMKEVLKVIKKYSSEEQVISLYNGDSDDKSFNFLAIILFIIDDYYNNGLYSNHQEIVEVNGEGDILWDKTINETYAYISNNSPYYLELYTENSVEDSNDYFTRLHKYILTECSNRLNSSKINNLFDIESINLFEGTIEEFGEKEYILYRLERELNVQYITRKQIILKTLYAYIAHSKAAEYGLGISFYGTNHFNLVWEKVCANVFNNKLNEKINMLPLSLSPKYKDKGNKTLSELIEKPLWKTYESNNEILVRKASKTLTPDLISIFKIEEGYGFAIFDAKYYNIGFTKEKVYNQPGVGDVTKQYLYQLAYKNFIESNGYKFVVNAFLVPDEGNKIVNIGQAEMSILSNFKNDNLKNIEIIELPARKMYELYIKDKHIDVALINLEINKNNISKNEYTTMVGEERKVYSKYPSTLKNNIGAKLFFDCITGIVSKNTYINIKLENESEDIIAEKLKYEKQIIEKIADMSIYINNISKELNNEEKKDVVLFTTKIKEYIYDNNSLGYILNREQINKDIIPNVLEIINKYYI